MDIRIKFDGGGARVLGFSCFNAGCEQCVKVYGRMQGCVLGVNVSVCFGVSGLGCVKYFYTFYW